MKRCLMACLIGIWASAALASGPSYKLFPLAALFTATSSVAEGSRIDPDFTIGVPGEIGGELFQRKFRAAFPESVSTIDNANKRRTFAVSLQVVRASKYAVKKPDGTDDIYLPITGSIYFTNVLTGEVLYALTKTEIKLASLRRDATGQGSARVQGLFRENFEELVVSLIQEARQKFQPTKIAVVVRGEWKGLAILDAGREQGVSRDDTLIDAQGNELRVLSAGPSYSIAQVELGSFKSGGEFAKVSNQTLAEIRKPRVLPIVEATPDGFPSETLLQLLTDALGAKAAISLTPVNRTYAAVLSSFAAKAAISQEQIRQRELPNFFFRLRVQEPLVYEAPTNLLHKTKRVYEAVALAELVDRSGRVLYAGIGRNRIEDEVTAGIAFNSAARKDVVVKNALLDLANRFAAEMKFVDAKLAVVQAGKEFTLRDDHGMLAKGSNWRVYRSIGTIDGIKDEVLVPTWEFEVSKVEADKASAVATLPMVNGVPEPAVGDVVFLNGVFGDGLVSRKRFGACPEQKLGAIEIPGYGELAQNIFASRYKAAYFSAGLGLKVADLVRAGSGFKNDLKLAEAAFDYCVEPVYRIDPLEAKCSDTACADVSSMRLTYRIRLNGVGGEIKARQGMETRLTAGMLPKETSIAVRATALRMDMLDEIVKLNAEIIPALVKENL